MFEVFISIGSNLGNRELNLNRSVSLLSGRYKILSASSIYETDPVGVKDQPDFLNAVIKIGTTMLPDCLLKFIKDIEAEMGREQKLRWGPRIIDLDIIYFGNLIVETPKLKIPHSHAHQRRFVMEPLCEIAPDLKHPVSGVDSKTILSEIKSDERTVRKGILITKIPQ